MIASIFRIPSYRQRERRHKKKLAKKSNKRPTNRVVNLGANTPCAETCSVDCPAQNTVTEPTTSTHQVSEESLRDEPEGLPRAPLPKADTVLNVKQKPTFHDYDCGSDEQSISDISESYDDRGPSWDKIESCLTYWTIECLDCPQDLGKGNNVWFRIYFHCEEEYVYYQGSEIIDYVRDLVELNGRSVFHVRRMSNSSLVIHSAGAVISKLGELINDIAHQPLAESIGVRPE